MDILSAITEEYKKSDIPAFGVGDTVKVHIKIKEGQREEFRYSKDSCSRNRTAASARLLQ